MYPSCQKKVIKAHLGRDRHLFPRWRGTTSLLTTRAIHFIGTINITGKYRPSLRLDFYLQTNLNLGKQLFNKVKWLQINKGRVFRLHPNGMGRFFVSRGYDGNSITPWNFDLFRHNEYGVLIAFSLSRGRLMNFVYVAERKWRLVIVPVSFSGWGQATLKIACKDFIFILSVRNLPSSPYMFLGNTLYVIKSI